MLFGAQLGGGTSIRTALAAAQPLVVEPKRTLVVLITDLEEGDDPRLMIEQLRRLRDEGVTVLCLLGLDMEAVPFTTTRTRATSRPWASRPWHARRQRGRDALRHGRSQPGHGRHRGADQGGAVSPASTGGAPRYRSVPPRRASRVRQVLARLGTLATDVARIGAERWHDGMTQVVRESARELDQLGLDRTAAVVAEVVAHLESASSGKTGGLRGGLGSGLAGGRPGASARPRAGVGSLPTHAGRRRGAALVALDLRARGPRSGACDADADPLVAPSHLARALLKLALLARAASNSRPARRGDGRSSPCCAARCIRTSARCSRVACWSRSASARAAAWRGTWAGWGSWRSRPVSSRRTGAASRGA